MRIIFDLGHPAHFHLFKHVISTLKSSDNDVELIARQKDCLLDLLERSGWSYHIVPRASSGLAATGWQTLKTFKVALLLARRKRTDFIVGTSLVAGPVARLTGAVSLIFSEDDAKEVPLFSKLTYPIAHYIITPDCLKYEGHGKKHLTYSGYHELAYLHPNRYTPDPGILKELGVGPDEKYFLVRLVSLTAHHDIGESGLGIEQVKTIVQRLARYGRVFISTEAVVDSSLRNYILPTSVDRIFDVLAFAGMVVGTSQTMTIESAVLGTPSIRCNTFVGRLTVIEELEHKYGLTAGFLPKDFGKLLDKMDEWLAQPDLKQKWQQKRQAMLAECVDLTDWTLELLNRLYLESRTEGNGL